MVAAIIRVATGGLGGMAYEDAEDAPQEMLLRAWQRLASFEANSAPASARRSLGAVRRGDMVDLRKYWLAADGLVARLDLGEDLRRSLKESFERWDGKGAFGAKGEEIRLTSRLVYLADVVEVYHRSGGLDAAVAVARERSGRHFDPALVDLFCHRAPELLADLDEGSNWEA